MGFWVVGVNVRRCLLTRGRRSAGTIPRIGLPTSYTIPNVATDAG